MGEIADYDKLKNDCQAFYKKIGRIQSPALDREIHFTSEGFNHLIYAKGATAREEASQIQRFTLLPLGVKLVKQATTYQEYEETIKEFEVKGKKKKVRKTKTVRYWSLLGIIDNRKIKVIIKQVGDNGTFQFWSVMPAWVTKKHPNLHFFTTMKGNPEED